MFGIVSSVNWPEIISDIVISLAGCATSRWPDWYGDRLFFQIWVSKDSVQINHCHSSEKYVNFIHRHRALPTIMHIDQWLGEGGGCYYHTDQSNGSLRVYFIIQILPFIDWTCASEECRATAGITEFANRSSVEWRGSHQWAVTCWIDVQSFCVWWHGNVAKMRTAPENAIFTQNLAMSATPVYIYVCVCVCVCFSKQN